MGALRWVGMRLAEGTKVCWRAAKNSFQACRSSTEERGGGPCAIAKPA
jgi:hypothetical protein